MNTVFDLRNKYRMTQDEFAEFCGVSRISIARYEAGAKVSRANAEKIASACGVSVSYVIGDSNNWRNFPPEIKSMITSELPLPQLPDLGHGSSRATPLPGQISDNTPGLPTKEIQISLKGQTSKPRGSVFRVPTRSKVAAMATARGTAFRSKTAEGALLGVKYPVTAEIDPLYARIHGLSTEERQRVSDFVAGIEAKK